MLYYLTVPNASASLLVVNRDGDNPHLSFEARKRALDIWQWVNDEFDRVPASFGAIHRTAELRKYGYLAIAAKASDPRIQAYVDDIARIAMRASNGCCERCDNPGNTFIEPGWLTTLCQSCHDHGRTAYESIVFFLGENYDLAA